jgi:hypothetical protein
MDRNVLKYSTELGPLQKYIVTCRMVHVTNNYGIRRMIGFITTSVTHALLITTKYQQYSAIVHLHQSQFTVANALGFLCFH